MNIGETQIVSGLALRAAGSVLARSYRIGTRLGLHAHREAQLLFASRGMMEVATPKGRWLVPPARAVWLPARMEHSVDVLADIEMRTLYVEPAWLRSHPEAPRLGREFVVAIKPLLRELILALFDTAMDRERDELLARLVLFELAEAEDPTTFIPMPSDIRARRVAELILADPASDLDLDGLSRRVGASPRTISRLFPEETELTFKQWRQRARILAAVEALSTGHLSIKQIAGRLGFSSIAAFIYAFREVMGVTPSALLRTLPEEPGQAYRLQSRRNHAGVPS